GLVVRVTRGVVCERAGISRSHERAAVERPAVLIRQQGRRCNARGNMQDGQQGDEEHNRANRVHVHVLSIKACTLQSMRCCASGVSARVACQYLYSLSTLVHLVQKSLLSFC